MLFWSMHYVILICLLCYHYLSILLIEYLFVLFLICIIYLYMYQIIHIYVSYYSYLCIILFLSKYLTNFIFVCLITHLCSSYYSYLFVSYYSYLFVSYIFLSVILCRINYYLCVCYINHVFINRIKNFNCELMMLICIFFVLSKCRLFTIFKILHHFGCWMNHVIWLMN